MHPLYLISGISGVVSATAFAVYAFQIKVTPFQIAALILLFVVSVIIGVVLKVVLAYQPALKKDDKEMERAEEYARNWWYKNRQESLLPLDGKGRERWFGKEKFFGFLFHRSATTGINAGLPVTVVIGSKPMRAVDWEDKPLATSISDPFYGFATVYSGNPVRDISPEDDPAFYAMRWGRGSKPSQQINIGTEDKAMKDFLGQNKEPEE